MIHKEHRLSDDKRQRSELITLLFALIAAAPAHVPSNLLLDATPTDACVGAEYRQFDFFAGDWDTYDVGVPETITARNHVMPMLSGCALREVYEQRDGLRGESFSTYDASRSLWHQSWVTNRGQLLLLDGQLEGDRMVLIATEREKGGASSLLRGVWWREGANVRERAERSRDGGVTWTPVFDIIFRPHRARTERIR
jgi:hypothetical protein